MHSIMYMPKYDSKAQMKIADTKGIIPNYCTRRGRFREPVPSAEASIAKIDP